MNELTTEQTTTGLSTLQQRYKLAQTLATSNLLPKHFQNQPANVFIAMELAESYSRNNADISFFSVMQNIYVVHGNVGMSAKFLIALANRSGVFDQPIKFDVTGSSSQMKVRAYTLMNGVEVDFTVDMAMANAEGWTKNPKYRTMPQLMLSYRAATSLIRLYAPEVTMGMQTDEEVLGDLQQKPVQVEKPKALEVLQEL